MDTKTFLDNFGYIADAQNGVQKIRELIFALAVQGKLVHQDSNNEIASSLLVRIEEDKKEVSKKGLYGRLKQLPTEEIIDPPFELPNSWSWSLLENISHTVHYGYTASAKPELTDVRLLRITDIQNNRVNWETVPGCEINEKNYKVNCLRANDILIARTGGTIGKTYLVDDLPVKAVFASYLIRVVPSMLMSSGYLKLFMESPLYWGQLYAKSAGTGQPNVNATSLRALQLPIPPLEEQKRIVAKVGQLMALCDQLETQQKQKAKTRVALNNAALDKLLTALNSKELNLHWQRIANNFHHLYDNLENITKLRAAILDLAVEGRLVAQDNNEIPASDLLEKVERERSEAIEDGVVKKTTLMPELSQEEELFNLPVGWCFERLGNLCRFIDYRGKTPNKVESGVRLITAKNIRMGHLQDEPREFVTENTYKEWMTRGFPENGDLLFTTEAPLGNVCMVNLDCRFALAQRAINLHPWADQYSQFLMYAIMSPLLQDTISAKATGMTATGIKAAKLKLIPIPVPPIEEQKRIVAKVDQLMALCDQLEANIRDKSDTAACYANAIVKQMAAA